MNMSKRNIKTKQAIAEKIVITVNNMVGSSMGPANSVFAPYIAAILIFSVMISSGIQ